MKYQRIDKNIKNKIDSLDQSIPKNTQWNPDKSWNQINDKLVRPNKRRIIPLVYLASTAACISLLILSFWIFNDEKSQQSKVQEFTSIEKEATGESSDLISTPIEKEEKENPVSRSMDQQYAKNSRKILKKDTQVEKLLISKDSLQNKPKEEIIVQEQVVSMPKDSSLIVKEAPVQRPKEKINQDVILTIAPGAEIWTRKRYKPSRKSKFVAKRKLKLRLKLGDKNHQFASKE